MTTFDEMLAKSYLPKRRPKDEEHRMQCACVRWFRITCPNLKYALFSVPNGGRRDATTAAKLKAEGVVAGVSDLILLMPNSKYHGLCIEMKTKKGQQSPDQKAFQAYCNTMGYLYVICRSLDDFMDHVKSYIDG